MHEESISTDPPLLPASVPVCRVLALDNLKRRGSELNLPRLRDAEVAFQHGDIRNPEDLEGVGDVDLILDCSAEPSVLAGYGSSPGYVTHTNLGGTINCLELARNCGAGMLFLSTSRVYPMKAVNALEFIEEETRYSLAAEQSVPGSFVRSTKIASSLPATISRTPSS